jgi:CheY-like chemotaxis protein
MSNILAVDDQSIIRVLMREALTRLGHRVTLACSGTEAIRLCLKHRYDLVILDYKMPDMSGLEVVELLKGRVRVILHTSDYDNWTLQLQAICSGAFGVIAKISNISAFQRSVNAFWMIRFQGVSLFHLSAFHYSRTWISALTVVDG